MRQEDWKEVLKLLKLKEAAEDKDKRFSPYDDDLGGERHGSWVWTCFKKDEDGKITRYVSFAITEGGDITASSPYLVEITIGADDSAHFHRETVNTFHYTTLEALKEGEGKLRSAFNKAMESVKNLTQKSLTCSYIRRPFSEKPCFKRGG